MLPLSSSLANNTAVEWSTNATAHVLDEKWSRGVSWNFPAIYTVVICSLVIALNGAVVVSILNSRELRGRPFNMYLLCLMTFNIFYAAIQNPLEIINDIYPVWWLGEEWCRVYVYAQSVISAGAMHTHVLIAINRVWAMTFPWTYRNFHSRKVAASLCLVLWIYVNAVILPGIVERMREFKQPLEVIGCSAQYQSRIWEQVVVYCVSELIMVIAFPIALYKRRRRQKTRQAPHAIVVHAAEGSVATGRTATTGAMDSSHMPVDPVPVMPQTNRHADRSCGFTVLVLLTCSVITCWTPASVAFLVASILHTRYPTIFQVAISLFDVVPVLDPILLTVAMQDLRKAMIDHLHAATRGRR